LKISEAEQEKLVQRGMTVEYECWGALDLPRGIFEWAFRLVETNMRTLSDCFFHLRHGVRITFIAPAIADMRGAPCHGMRRTRGRK